MDTSEKNHVNEWNDLESPRYRLSGDRWHTVVPKVSGMTGEISPNPEEPVSDGEEDSPEAGREISE
ncbi:MAG: hypothetical protein RLZZ214_1316 [Verrucomicrobiota bacterium]|jgi:hypothetical protein